MFTWLGAASYAIYVLQAPLYPLTLVFVTLIFGKISQGGLGLSWGVIFVVFVFAVAIIADRYFDRPVRAILMARFASPSALRQFSRAGELQGIR